MHSLRHHAAVWALAACAAAPALADTVKFHAVLAPGQEVPAVKDAGAGTADATLDTASHHLTYDLAFSGFTSPVTMAHFHGPGRVGRQRRRGRAAWHEPGEPVARARSRLTADQQTQLLGGLWYANLHTAAHPKGAARGQMVKQ